MLIEKFDIRSSQGEKSIARGMSGGNQQKAIIARELDRNPEIVIAVQPVRGLDVGAIEYIHKQLIEQRDAGKAVLLVSLELDEVMNVSDRIIVMYEGEIVADLDPKKIAGNIIVIRLMNRTGFEHRTMSLTYEDGKNLNRVFPGNPNGTLSDRIAYTVVTEFFSKVDYYIDLHCGDGFEGLVSYVYCTGAAAPEVAAKSREMAEIAHVDYLVTSMYGTGGATTMLEVWGFQVSCWNVDTAPAGVKIWLQKMFMM